VLVPGDNFLSVNMTDISTTLEKSANGVIIRIEVTPGSKRVEFPCCFNLWRNTIGCALIEPALNGKANKALIELISDFFNVSKVDITIISGLHSRIKRVRIEGITEKEAISKIIL